MPSKMRAGLSTAGWLLGLAWRHTVPVAGMVMVAPVLKETPYVSVHRQAVLAYPTATATPAVLYS